LAFHYTASSRRLQNSILKKRYCSIREDVNNVLLKRLFFILNLNRFEAYRKVLVWTEWLRLSAFVVHQRQSIDRRRCRP